MNSSMSLQIAALRFKFRLTTKLGAQNTTSLCFFFSPSAILSKNAPLCWTCRDLEIVIQISKRQSKTLHAVMCFELQMCCIMTAFSIRASPLSVCCLTRTTFDFIKKLTAVTATHDISWGWLDTHLVSVLTELCYENSSIYLRVPV